MTDTACLECGKHSIYLGDGTWMCSALYAYGMELVRRGDKRTVSHEVMRADGQRIWENVGGQGGYHRG